MRSVFEVAGWAPCLFGYSENGSIAIYSVACCAGRGDGLLPKYIEYSYEALQLEVGADFKE